MKIIRTAEDVRAKSDAREKANEGCGVCPCCGNAVERPRYNYLQVMPTGRFRTATMQIDNYSCPECGAEWESEPYPV